MSAMMSFASLIAPSLNNLPWSSTLGGAAAGAAALVSATRITAGSKRETQADIVHLTSRTAPAAYCRPAALYHYPRRPAGRTGGEDHLGIRPVQIVPPLL